MIHGVDVHPEYQRGLSMAALAKQGITFAVVKATEGTSYYATGPTRSDPDFAAWIGQIRTAGMIPGAYHWLHRGNAAKQVDWFLQALAQVGGPEGLIIQLDVEDINDPPDWPTLQAWDAEWKRRTGGHPYLIYTGGWWWTAAGRRWPGAQLTPYLWHSHYLMDGDQPMSGTAQTLAPRVPQPWWTPGYGDWGRATILQYTSRGNAGGLTANVDLNAYTGTREQLLALTRRDGDDMALSPDEAQLLADIHWTLTQIPDATGKVGPDGRRVTVPLHAWCAQVDAAIDALAAHGGVPDGQLAAIRSEVRDALGDLAEGGAAAVRAG